MDEAMESWLIELEIRLAHYKQKWDDLNGGNTRQQLEVQNLKRQIEMILVHIRGCEADEATEL